MIQSKPLSTRSGACSSFRRPTASFDWVELSASAGALGRQGSRQGCLLHLIPCFLLQPSKTTTELNCAPYHVRWKWHCFIIALLFAHQPTLLVFIFLLGLESYLFLGKSIPSKALALWTTTCMVRVGSQWKAFQKMR